MVRHPVQSASNPIFRKTLNALAARIKVSSTYPQRKAISRRAVDQRAADATLARMRLDPHSCDPWREVWTLGEIGYDHGRGTQKRPVVMGDQRKRYRVGVEI